MSFSAAQLAMIRHVFTMPGRPNFVGPGDPTAPLPRYVVQEAGGSTRTRSIGRMTDARVTISVRVETASGGTANENRELVAALEARFAPGTKFGGVLIETAPSVRPPLEDGATYAVPVQITGRTFY